MSSAETPGLPPRAPSWRRDLLILAAAFGVLYFLFLGSAPLGNPDEGRYAEIPREMIATGDWVTPRLDGVNYFEKPPLMYWAVAVCLEAFGRNAWAARTAPALFGIGGILLAYAAGRRLRGREAGWWSAVALGTSTLYFALSHMPLIDIAVSVLMSAALFAFLLAVREPPGRRRRFLFYGHYAAAALATLAKGLIGFLLPGAVMFLWLLLYRQWRRLRPFHLPTGMVLFLAIAAPWHVLVALRNPAWAHFYFIHEQWDRFLTREAGRYQPWWFFLPVVILGIFPWTGFLWPALRSALAGGWRRRRERADEGFLLVWAAFVFLFFSKSDSKLIPYILPVFPPLAVLIGIELAGGGSPVRRRLGFAVFRLFSGILAAAALVAVYSPGLIRDPSVAVSLRPFAWALAAILILGGTLARSRAAVAAAGALFLAALVAAEPRFPLRSTKPLALECRALFRPGDRLYNYHQFFHDFTFYTGRTVKLVAYRGELEPENDPSPRARAQFVSEAQFRRQWDAPVRAFAVARKGDARQLFASPGFHYHLLGETPDCYLFSNQP
jgi:4-amino-4-deoxy-L-arabinose transferase-like glycosyltransferase